MYLNISVLIQEISPKSITVFTLLLLYQFKLVGTSAKAVCIQLQRGPVWDVIRIFTLKRQPHRGLHVLQPISLEAPSCSLITGLF